MKAFSWLRICLVLAVGLSTAWAKAPAQPIAVVDFSIPGTESNRWAWARSGLADLLQIELEHLGLETLDRDFIHAVITEQRLALLWRWRMTRCVLSWLRVIRGCGSGCAPAERSWPMRLVSGLLH